MLSIAVQAGGRSSRMGTDKALIDFAGRRLIEHVLERLRGLSDDLFITSNHDQPLKDLGLRLVADEVPGLGALHGLRTALLAARHDNVLTVACDMPFISSELVAHMLSLQGRADVILPQLAGEYEPMLALYRSGACLPAIDDALREGRRRMISFFPQVTVHPVGEQAFDRYDPDRLSLFNVNTPEDLERAEQLYAEGQAQLPGSHNAHFDHPSQGGP